MVREVGPARGREGGKHGIHRQVEIEDGIRCAGRAGGVLKRYSRRQIDGVGQAAGGVAVIVTLPREVGQIEPAQVPVLIPSLSKVNDRSTAAARAALGAAVASIAAKTALAIPTNALSFMRPSETFPHLAGKNTISAGAIKTATDRLSSQQRPMDKETYAHLRTLRSALGTIRNKAYQRSQITGRTEVSGGLQHHPACWNATSSSDAPMAPSGSRIEDAPTLPGEAIAGRDRQSAARARLAIGARNPTFPCQTAALEFVASGWLVRDYSAARRPPLAFRASTGFR